MRYSELRIETRRQIPARARTDGERFLIRAGYLSAAGELTPLGEAAVRRLHAAVSADPASWSLVGPTIVTSSHETVIESSTGDFDLLRCMECGYVDALQTARRQRTPPPVESMLPLGRVETPDCGTIDALSAFLGVPQSRTAKALLYVRPGTDHLAIVIIRGDMQASEAKMKAAAGSFVAATHAQIVAAGAVPGYASPIGLERAEILVDEIIPLSPNLVAGANEHGFHLLNTNFGRDYQAVTVTDLTLARPGDLCTVCGSSLQAAFGYLVADASGYRSHAALLCLAENHHDDGGLNIPMGIGAFDVHLLHLPSRTALTGPVADEVHSTLEGAGIPVLYDDRDERAGVKFNDADLIGCPLRITVGERHLKDRMVEFKARSASNVELVPVDALVERVHSLAKISP